MTPREHARAWAREIFEHTWTAERFRLELTKETMPTQRSLKRPVYRAEFAVWERTGVAIVRLDRAGCVRGVRYPVSDDDLPPDPEPIDLEHAPEAACRAAIAVAGPGQQIRAAARLVERAHVDLVLTLEHLPPDGTIAIELDPGDGRRLSYTAQPFLRGSTRSAALNRTAAIKRARAALQISDAARLTRAELVLTSGGARVWRIRWRIEGAPGEASGFVRALINARSGLIAGLLIDLRVGIDHQARPPQDVSQRRLDEFVRLRFGPHASASPLVPGATQVGEDYVGAWLSVITTPKRLVRATVVGERIELGKLRLLKRAG